MRQISWRSGQFALVVCMLVMSTGALFARSLVWEAENCGKLSGKSFKVMKLTQDPKGKVSGNKVIGIGKFPHGVKVPADSITYKVKVPTTVRYYLWARVRWSTGCGNSILTSVAGTKGNFLIGGDGTYDSLHWLSLNSSGKPRPLSLKQGTVAFTLKSKESGVRVDQFLLTDDARYTPAGAYSASANLLSK